MHDIERRFLWIGLAITALMITVCVVLIAFAEPDSGEGDLILIPTGDGTIVPVWFTKPATQP